MHNMRRITRFEVYAVDNDVYLENGEVRITNPDIKVCLACDVGDLENKTEEMILHHKCKRCLAMAEWCNSEMGRETFACFRPRHTKEVWREEHKYWAKWRKIWFELYIKFKEAK